MRSSERSQTILRLWYGTFGQECGYCGTEMLPLDEALRVNALGRVEARRGLSKAEKRRAKNHPTIDHVVPRSKGGDNKIKNYAVVCDHCNQEKADDEHPGLSREMKRAWFDTVDHYVIEMGSEPYPDPY